MVSIPLKNISQIGSSSQLLGKIKNVPNHQPEQNGLTLFSKTAVGLSPFPMKTAMLGSRKETNDPRITYDLHTKLIHFFSSGILLHILYIYITVFPTKFYISRYIWDIPPEKTLNLQCHTAINTQVLKDPCFDPAPQRIGLERSKNGAVDCAISALLRRLSENGLQKSPQVSHAKNLWVSLFFPILPILPWPSLAQPVSSIGGQSASSMPRKVSWFHSESRRTLRRAPGVRGTRIPTWRHSKRI